MASYEVKDNLPVIGGVAIPSLDLTLPILNGLTDTNLYAGAGTMTPDQVMGLENYPLVSHNMAKPGLLFSDIEHMNAGDLIYLTDLTHVYVYETVSVEMVAPTRVDVINEVPGELVEKIATEDATTDILELFDL